MPVCMVVCMSDSSFDADDFDADNEPVATSAPAPTSAPKNTSAPSPSRQRRSARAEKSSVRRTTIRAALDRYVKICESPAPVREAMAALLSCPNNEIDIAVHAQTAKADVRAIRALVDIREVDDDMEAVVMAATTLTQDKALLTIAWSLIQAVAPTSSESPVKRGVTQAAVQIVRCVREMDDSSVAVLNNAADALS